MSKRGEKHEWLQVAEAFEASGLTQKEFSTQGGLRLSTLQSWVYRRRRQRTWKAQAVRLLPVEVPAVAQADWSGASTSKPSGRCTGLWRDGTAVLRRGPGTSRLSPSTSWRRLQLRRSSEEGADC